MKRRRGRPSKKDTISNKKVEELASQGLTDKQLADVFKITEATLNNWKKDPKFFESLKKGKSKADNYVVGSLFQRALGYSHPEVQLFRYRDKIIKAEVIKHYPPDVTACIFWLKNRQPELWRDRQDHDITLKEFKYAEFKHTDRDTLKREAEELASQIIANRRRVSLPEEDKSA